MDVSSARVAVFVSGFAGMVFGRGGNLCLPMIVTSVKGYITGW